MDDMLTADDVQDDGGVLTDFREGTIADRYMSRRLCKKWSKLLEGVRKDKTKKILARMYENQMNHLRSKVPLTEQTKAADVGPFTRFVFPILRRVFPNIITPDIVSVQPMAGPVGAIFFFDLVYATAKGSISAGDLLIRDFSPYYSSEYIDGEVIAVATAATVYGATLNFTPIRNAAGNVVPLPLRVKYTLSSVETTATADPAGTLTGTGLTSGSVNYQTGAITLTFAGAPDIGTDIGVFYEYISEASAVVPQVNLQVALQEIRAYSRKLKALTSSEAAEDLRFLHGIEADDELVTQTADEIGLEIDREIIIDLMDAADAGTNKETYDRSVPSGISEVEHLRALLTKMSSVANQIKKATKRRAANWAVLSPEVSTLIEQLATSGEFRPNVFPVEPSTDLPDGDFGVYLMGVLQNRWNIYQNPDHEPTNKILMGLKGRSFMDAGFAWAPYIPLQVTQTFLDPNDFTLKKGMRTRYGKKLLRPEYYGEITVNNL